MKNPKETYHWRFANECVRAFMRKYARVSLFICAKLDIDIRDYREALINIFMYNNPRWNMAREAIKWIDKADMYEYFQPMAAEHFRKYLKTVKSLQIDDYLDGKNSGKAIDPA